MALWVVGWPRLAAGPMGTCDTREGNGAKIQTARHSSTFTNVCEFLSVLMVAVCWMLAAKALSWFWDRLRTRRVGEMLTPYLSNTCCCRALEVATTVSGGWFTA